MNQVQGNNPNFRWTVGGVPYGKVDVQSIKDVICLKREKVERAKVTIDCIRGIDLCQNM